MAFDAFLSSFMSSVLYAEETGSRAIRVFEIGMATEAKFSGGIERQKLDVIRMIDRGAMAILTFDRLMSRSVEHVNVFLVAFNAGLSALVLHGKFLPLLDVTQAMKTVGEIPAVNAEVIRNHK